MRWSVFIQASSCLKSASRIFFLDHCGAHTVNIKNNPLCPPRAPRDLTLPLPLHSLFDGSNTSLNQRDQALSAHEQPSVNPQADLPRPRRLKDLGTRLRDKPRTNGTTTPIAPPVPSSTVDGAVASRATARNGRTATPGKGQRATSDRPAQVPREESSVRLKELQPWYW